MAASRIVACACSAVFTSVVGLQTTSASSCGAGQRQAPYRHPSMHQQLQLKSLGLISHAKDEAEARAGALGLGAAFAAAGAGALAQLGTMGQLVAVLEATFPDPCKPWCNQYLCNNPMCDSCHVCARQDRGHGTCSFVRAIKLQPAGRGSEPSHRPSRREMFQHIGHN